MKGYRGKFVGARWNLKLKLDAGQGVAGGGGAGTEPLRRTVREHGSDCLEGLADVAHQRL